jgi:hypothetical protein
MFLNQALEYASLSVGSPLVVVKPVESLVEALKLPIRHGEKISPK